MAEIDRIEIGRKAADGTLTIGEAMSVRTGSAAKTILNRVKALGYSVDDNWSTVSTDKFLRELQDIGSSSNFVELGATEQILAKLAAQSEEGAEYKYKFGYGAGGRANQLELSKNKQPRGTSEAGKGVIKFEGVPPGRQSLPAIVEGINAISKDSVVLNADGNPTKTKLGPKADQIRDALVVNLMIPLRPGEIRKIGIDDINFETGRFSDRFQRVNKIRNPVEIDEVLLEILRDARDRAVANGQSVLFDITDTQLLNGVRVQGGIMEKMRPYEGILGRPFKNAMDVRKIVPSLMHGELGAGIELSQIMGHETYDAMMGGLKKMTAARYVSPVVSDEGSAVKGVMRAYRNYMAETLGITVLNDLPSKLGVTASRLETEGAPKFAVVPTGGDVAPGPDGTRIGQVTAEDAEVAAQNRATNLEQSRLAETRAKSERLDLLKDIPAKEKAAIEADEERRIREKEIRAAVRASKLDQTGDTPEGSISDSSIEKLKELGLWDKLTSANKTLKSGLLATAGAAAAVLKVVPGPAADLGSAVLDKSLQGDGPDPYDVAQEKGAKFMGDLLGVEPRKATSVRDVFTPEVAAYTAGKLGATIIESATGALSREPSGEQVEPSFMREARERREARDMRDEFGNIPEEGFVPKRDTTKEAIPPQTI